MTLLDALSASIQCVLVAAELYLARSRGAVTVFWSRTAITCDSLKKSDMRC